MDYTRHFATRLMRLFTPQHEPIPNTSQVPNSAGGYAFPVDRWSRLDRFLVLGSEGGTYYIGERTLTQENAKAVVECLAEDGLRTVERILEVSVAGRAPKNDPALFALAIAAGVGDAPTQAKAWEVLPSVARTGTHLLHFLQYLKAFRGWGRSVRRAVAAWYTAKPAEELLYQVLKYPSRDGWAQRDALRLAHPKAPTVAHDLVFRYATKGWEGVVTLAGVGDMAVVQTMEAVESLQFQAPGLAAQTIARHGLTREMVPTPLLQHAVVWEALLERMPLTALVRNLGTMTKVGLLAPYSRAAKRVVERLGDTAAIRKARVHPVAILAALKTYAQGHGMKGKNSWQPVAQVVDALDRAFYLAFRNAPSTGRRVMLALDVSGSMTSRVLGMEYLSCREASAAMALVTAATEPHHRFTAFTAGNHPSRWGPQLGAGLSTLAISPRQRLDDVVRRITGLTFGGTDCALPMLEALKHRWAIDLFVIYTDNETWAGAVHPAQALRLYRERMGIPAKLVVVGMASNGFSIADPADAGMLDVVGFDSAVPELLAEFGR
ncbi:MAG: TROVE domain-containing protein [Gemmatimonadales bacterium]